MTKPVQLLQPLLPRNFIYCDVGARGGLAGHPWARLTPLVEVISFEPDEEEFQRLAATCTTGHRVFNYALHKESGMAPLYLTRSRGCSSLYRPNPAVLNAFPEADRYLVDKEVLIPTIRLDDLGAQGEIKDIDFIKIDVQGAGLDVLSGARDFLQDHILGVEIEVEFQLNYSGQALFSDIDSFLRQEFGFELMDLRKSYWKRRQGLGIGPLKGQLVFGDALFMKSPDGIAELCRKLTREEQQAKICMACCMGLAYGYADYVLCLLEHEELSAMLDRGLRQSLLTCAREYTRCVYLHFPGSRYLAEIFSILHRVLQPHYGGWSTTGQHLGSRKRFNIFT